MSVPRLSQKKEKVGVLNVEMVPVSPRKTEITENVKLIQKIYSENKVRKRALL